jgi:hypothetical protein
MMDCRVKPGNDGIGDNSPLSEVAISTPPGTSGLLAFEMEIGK